MKKIFLSVVVLLGLQNTVFAIEEIPSWNDFAPSVIKQEHQAYWDARYREFESELNSCKALPITQRTSCFNQLTINEREKNNSFYANPTTITSSPAPTVNEVRSSTFALSIGYPSIYSYRYWDYPIIYPSYHYVRHYRVPPCHVYRPYIHHVSHHHPVHMHHHSHHSHHHRR